MDHPKKGNRQDLIRKLEGGRSESRGEKKREEENIGDWDVQEGERTVKGRKERDILIEGVRNTALRKFPEIHKDGR